MSGDHSDWAGAIAVVTGGGTGMGRELVAQLAAQGCHIAMCDVSADDMADSAANAARGARPGVRVTTFVADVSDEPRMHAFAADTAQQHGAAHINLLFNNAGIGGGASFVLDDRAEWDKVFAVCWGGVYGTTRAFRQALLAAEWGVVVNTSSVNGFWAALGVGTAHTAYSSAKFAVKGFTEALLTDFRINAPHLRAAVVMPGHIGTSIALNSMRTFGRNPKELTTEQIAEMRDRWARQGLDMSAASDEDLRQGIQAMAESFRDNAPTTAAEAATMIIDRVKAGEWRILVGDDAAAIDEMVRAQPDTAYSPEFSDLLRAKGLFGFAER
jgi:NAD(P)-dependent dehydrogenase (short-subunit alcohol dehydrogenase family)